MRPLLDRLHDIEHALKLDRQPLHAATIREAIETLQGLPASEVVVDLRHYLGWRRDR